MWRNFQERLSNDPRFSRRFYALRKAQQTLSEAQARSNAGDAKGFYALLYKALNTYLADKFHKPSGVAALDEVVEGLHQKNIGPNIIRAVKDIYEACDLVRFAATSHDPAQMKQHLAQAREIITLLEKKL